MSSFTQLNGDVDNETNAARKRHDSYGSYQEATQVTFTPAYSKINKKKKQKPDRAPIDKANWLSILTYSWVTPLFIKAWKGTLTTEDITVGSAKDTSNENGKRLETRWKEQRVQGDGSLLKVLLYCERKAFLLGIVSQCVGFCAGYVQATIVLRKLISFTQLPEADYTYGILLVVLFTSLQVFSAFSIGLSFYLNTRLAGRLRGALLSLIYKKITRLRSLKSKSVGEIVNLCTNDSQRVFDLGLYLSMGVTGLLLCMISLVTSYFVIGWTAVIGTLTYILFYPIQVCFSKLITHFRQQCIVVTDSRVRLMSEVITCIKLIKMYAWEMPFARKIAAIRNLERKSLEKVGYLQSISTGTLPVAPILSAAVTFILHTSLGYELDIPQAFTYLALLNATRVILVGTPFAAKAIAETMVAMPRIKELLLMEEIESVASKPHNPENCIVINGATFAWDKEAASQDSNADLQPNGAKPERPKDGEADVLLEDNSLLISRLFDLNVIVKKGQLLGICGSVGSGKSSFISAILGRMVKVSGSIALDGSMAYVSQQACVFNATLRENILFGEVYDEERYNRAIEACSLQFDLEVLPQGDKTEIGERGINLSGGQKQRVSMARAVYADSDIYLLDDPLSAVDAHVGQHIFRHCIKDTLRDKTVIFVTHQLQYLCDCDYVILMRDGKIAEEGNHDNLMAKDGEYATLLRTFHMEDEQEERMAEEPQSHTPQHRSKTSLGGASSYCSLSPADDVVGSVMDLTSLSEDQDFEGGLIEAESIEMTTSRFDSALVYLRACGGFIVGFLIIILFIIVTGGNLFSSWWLSYWFQQGDGGLSPNSTLQNPGSILDNPNLQFYQLVFACSVPALTLISLIKSVAYTKTTLRATTHLHDNVFQRVVSCPMSFFDTNPSGRILNRFSKDMDEVDVRLPYMVENFLQNILLMLSSIALVAAVFPWFLIAVAIFLMFFLVLLMLFKRTITHIKRVDNVSRSPWFAHLMTTVQSLSTVHAYGKTDSFIQKFHRLLDENSSPKVMFYIANRWLAFRLDCLTMMMIMTCALCVVFTHGIIPPSMAGLALSYATSLLGLFQYTIRMTTEVEAHFTSVERIVDYIENLKSEAPAKIKDHEPPADWPDKGTISFEKVKMRYRDNLPLVLRGISFQTCSREKIGIVGRTGSGKSSIGVSLFRLVEVSSGDITIDGINISSIGLHDLRSKLAIIPQDPVLFIGTIRYNLDPFDQYSDEEIWSALEKTYMKDSVSKLESQLEAPVVENGDNFSVGERQLLCMARAVLRNSKILMLDEATAAIDTETDSLVQSTIREAFSDCTLLTIAHRLQTVLDSDKIIVLDDGKIAEFDTPSKLLADPNSLFSIMVSSMTSKDPKDNEN